VTAELINTGTELMMGFVLNTHQQWLCRQLTDAGYVVARQTAISDTGAEIQQAVREAMARVPVIVTTAELWTTETDLAGAELESGMLDKQLGGVERRDWLWFQYHQSPGLRHRAKTYFDSLGAPESREGLAPVLDEEFARAIAIVSPGGIESFVRSGLSGF
jgi:hypothetical protein